MSESPEFPVVLRGYDARQVDALIDSLDAGAVTAQQARAQLGAIAKALRGYDRAQVEAYFDARVNAAR